MRVRYGRYSTESSSAKVLFGDTKKGYAFADFDSDSFSRFLGFHSSYAIKDSWDLAKFVHSFQPLRSPISIEKLQHGVKVEYDSGSLLYTFADGLCCIDVEGEFTIPLILDCRAIYDWDTTGRFYDVFERDGHIVIAYTKRNGDSMDAPVSKLGSKDYEMYVVISGYFSSTQRQEWIERVYALEGARAANPTSSYVFHVLDAKFSGSDSVQIAYGFDLDACIAKLSACPVASCDIPTWASSKISEKISVAAEQAYHSYVQLTQNDGLFAGYPWFFQYWARDEAISLKPLLWTDVQKCVKVLFRELKSLRSDGRIANRHPHSELGSADGIGWMCKRFLDVLEEKPSQFSKAELEFLLNTITASLANLELSYLRDGLMYNAPLETWMDTGEPYDVRSGFRVEIQALYLVQYRLCNYIRMLLGQEIDHKEFEVAKLVKEKLFKGVLHDGLREDGSLDETVRPNIFLAYYIYPDLLHSDEWEKTFDNALVSLWQDWGGVSTIELGHSLYKPYYTGQTNESYHRGDVWYWVNNMAGICLYNINATKYKTHINAILYSSATEILTMGVLGSPSEVSDSVKLASHGCFSQLWSAAMFLELVRVVGGE